MYNKTKTGKRVWMWVLIVLLGLIVGGTVGYYVENVPYLSWLSLGPDPIGLSLDEPLRLSLGVIQFSLGLTLKANIGGALGVIVAVILFKRT